MSWGRVDRDRPDAVRVGVGVVVAEVVGPEAPHLRVPSRRVQGVRQGVRHARVGGPVDESTRRRHTDDTVVVDVDGPRT